MDELLLDSSDRLSFAPPFASLTSGIPTLELLPFWTFLHTHLHDDWTDLVSQRSSSSCMTKTVLEQLSLRARSPSYCGSQGLGVIGRLGASGEGIIV